MFLVSTGRNERRSHVSLNPRVYVYLGNGGLLPLPNDINLILAAFRSLYLPEIKNNSYQATCRADRQSSPVLCSEISFC